MKAGFTGHRDLGSSGAWLSDELLRVIRELGVTCGLTSLAAGGDQVFAQVLLRSKIPYLAVIPCEGYERTFSARERSTYTRLLHLAHSRVTLEFDRPSDVAFYEAGKRVVDGADFLIAAWDGMPAHGLGGTADIVAYARSQGKLVVHLDHVNRRVREISDFR